MFGSFSGRDHLGLGVLFLMILANLPKSSPLIVSCTLSTLLFLHFSSGPSFHSVGPPRDWLRETMLPALEPMFCV